ncbi:thiaminase II [Clostridium perfringens]|nr:thiaminase II [Clostridium perfringens]EHK2280045.1 thiaminase II [Clostridium perfringens]ELC8405136.1 thiaminase II [Clostridium perfringens]MDY2583180.1 thiaminase II [Clostridium perfringens]
MKFTEKLLKESMPIWEKYLEHPFIKEIGEGTLDKNKFREYLVQDYLYLKEYAKVFCVGVVKAKTMEEMKFFYNSTKGTMEDETAVHIEYLKEFGISELDAEKREYNSTTISYTSYMQAIALTGDLDEIAIATLPCTWSYSYIGKYISKKYSNKLQGNFFKPWIDEYASDGFAKFTDEWLAYVDKKCSNLSEEKQKRLIDIFKRASLYELDFWNMAYDEGEK